MENVHAQLTQVQRQTKPEGPLESVAKEVQPEAQLEPTAKENIPAVTADTAALITTLQTMQQDMQQTMQQSMQNGISALQTHVQTQLTDQQRSAQAWLQSMEARVAQEQRTVFAKVDAKITSAGMGFEELANNAYESHLVVQDLKKNMDEQEQRVGTMNTAISNLILTRGAKQASRRSQPPSYSPPVRKNIRNPRFCVCFFGAHPPVPFGLSSPPAAAAAGAALPSLLRGWE
jgi:hypothetical protein